MNDKIRDEYELEFTAKGADRVAGQVDRLQDTLDALARSGDLSEKGLVQTSRAAQRLGSSLGTSTSAVKRYSDSFAQLRKDASAAETAIQRAAQNYTGRGGTNPLGYSANNMSLADAQKFNAVNKASSLTLQQAAQERLRLEDRLNTAKAQGAATDQKLANLGRDKVAVAKENLDLAQKELQAANTQKAGLGASGGRRGGGAATISDEVAAEERLASAKKGVLEAQRGLNAVTADGTANSAALRYANYDLASSYGAISAAIIGIGALTASTFADIESGFSAVERTSGLYGSAVAPLRDELLELSRVLPVTTQEIQSFAARGAQLGIAQDSIADFTETIAKFVATSPEVDINSVAEAFGRISNLTGEDDFEAIASAIAKVGVNAAATDQQIIKTTQEIARATSATTLSASEVIGLAGAFASLGIAPEAARGIFNQFFTQLDKGAAGLNDSLSVAANVIGTTEEAARHLYQTDTAEFFDQFVRGLSQVENVSEVLNALGTEGARLGPAFKALARDARDNAAGQSVLANALRDANTGFAERTELERQYAPIADDLNSKLLLLGNAFRELAYTIGIELGPALKGGVDALTAMVQGVTDFINSPIGGYITGLVASVAGLVAAYTGLRAVIALASASLIAFTQVAGALKGVGLVASLQGIRGAFTTTAIAADGTSKSVFSLRAALLAVGRATIIGAVLQYIAEWMFNTGDAALDLADKLQFVGNVASGIWGGLANLTKNSAPGISDAFKRVGLAISLGGQVVSGSLREFGTEFNKNREPVLDLTDAAGLAADAIEEIADYTPGAADGVGDLGDAADDAAQKVYTLVDYAGDLKSVFDRAFDIRNGPEAALDAITTKTLDIADAFKKAEQTVRDLRATITSLKADIQGLNSDISIQEYFLGIAREYGDTKRATAIEADLAKKRAELAEKSNQLKDKNGELKNALDATSRSTEGNSRQAILNRQNLRDLTQANAAYIQALAASGASQEVLRQKTEELRQKFIQQTTQMGFSRQEVGRYSQSFRDLTQVINSIPRKITVDTSGLKPAAAALKEFAAKAASEMNKVRNAANGAGGAINGASGAANNARGAGAGAYAQYQIEARAAAIKAQALANILSLNAQIATAGTGPGSAALRAILLAQISMWRNIGGFMTGGYTGSGAAGDVAGVVHRGEYVIPKGDVNQSTGLPYSDALGRLMGGAPSRSVAPSAQAQSAGVPTVSLSAGTIQAIAQATGKAIYLDGRMIADASANVYAQQNTVGAF